MSAIKNNRTKITSLRTLFEVTSDSNLGSGNIIKFFSEMAKGAKTAAASVDSSAGTIKKALAGISGGAKGAWNSIGLFGKIGIGVAAVTTAYNVLSKLEQNAREDRQNSFDNAMSAASESSSVYDLYKAYEAANEAYDGSTSSKEALEAATSSLAGALHKEKDAIDGVNDSLRDATGAELEEAISKAEDAVLAAQIKLAGNGTGGSINFKTAGNKNYIRRAAFAIMADAGDDAYKYDIGVSDSVERSDHLVNIYNKLIERRKELADSGKYDSIGYKALDQAINYLKPDIDDLTSAQNQLNDSTEKYNSFLNPSSDDNVTSAIQKRGDDIKTASDQTIKAITDIQNAQKALASQEAGKSISPSDFTSDDLKGYASALEYVNGVYQLSAEKVTKLVEAKAKEQIRANKTNKAYAQSEYLKNAKQIAEYRRQLANAANTENADTQAIKANIETLLNKNAALKDQCSQYDLMNSALVEATGAYQNWINAQSSSNPGDMFDDALTALKEINDTLNNSESDLYQRIGREGYKTALDFVIPDTVDKEDQDAVNSYLASLKSLLWTDDDGNFLGLNSDKFYELAEDAKLIERSADGWEITAGTKMQDFADKLNLALPLVRAIFGEFQEYGGKFDWADEAAQTIGDLGVKAYDSVEALQSLSQFKDLKIVMDVSEFEDADKACETLDETITQMNGIKLNLNPEINENELNQVNDIIRYCVAQKQLLSNPDVMSVDTSKITSDLGTVLDLLQQYQTAKNNLDMEIAVDPNTDVTDIKGEIDTVVSKVQALNPEVLAKVGLDPSSGEAEINACIQKLDADAIVKLGIGPSLVDAFESADHTATGTVEWYDDVENLSQSFDAIGYVHWKDANTVSYGGGRVNGSANVSGSALMRGNWRVKGGKSLVGELGREIVVDPNTGRWYTVGDNGAEFVNLPEGAIVFNHRQSDALLENGKVAGRGAAHVNGSAFVSGTFPGTIPRPRPSSGSGSTTTSPGSSASNSIGGGDSSSSYEEELELFDWIEVAISRIERIVEKLKKTADSTFKALNIRLEASRNQISAITKELDVQQRGYERYMSAADAVGLPDTLKSLVQSGAIDISQYDKDTKKLIDDYKELYEKALACADSIDDLHEALAEIYKGNFDSIQSNYSNRLELMEKQATAIQNRSDLLDTKGYLLNATHYEALQKIQMDRIDAMKLELIDLSKAFDDAMASGEIDEGSEAWFEMLGAIEDTKNAIDEASISVADYANKIREIEWSYFDYAQERVSSMVSEAEFLSSLIEDNGMYDDHGQLSDAGISSIGISAEKYGIYMAQADKYADEIKRINADIAKDPNNKKLIERRDELLAAQRESILSAKEEKNAMIDLVKNGIQTELDAVKELIDAYNDSLDSAKDLYDYQKQIADKTEDISKLEKQLAAYQNDMSEETRSKIQKIQVELKTAKEDLKDTEYQRFVSDSKKLLDSMYSDYEDVLNRRFDDTDALFERLIEMVNENYTNISDYFTDAAGKVGYTVTDATKSIWENGGVANGIVTEYGTKVSDGISSVAMTVENIFGVLEEIARQNGVSFVGKKSYRSGGLIDYTGLANVHGSADNPEMVLNADDTKNFILLRDAMRSGAMDSMFGSVRLGNILDKIGTVDTRTIGKSKSDDYSVGAINISIPIEHVEDYNDFVNQLRNDKKFEQMVQAMTVGRLAGKSSLEKNKYKW